MKIPIIKKTLLLSTVIIAGIALIYFTGCQKQASTWKGTITEDNGVTVVKNTKEPIYEPGVFILEEELSISETPEREELIFSQIRSIDVDESGRLYILDQGEAHVYVFDPNGNYIKSIGKKGQGPGELHMPFTMAITSDQELMVEDFRNKINFYSLEGDFIREIKTAKEAALRIFMDSRGNFFGTVFVYEEEDPRYEVRKYDPQMKRLASLGTSPLPGARNEAFNPFGGAVMYAIRNDDHVICGSPEKYEFNVYDLDANLEMKIIKDYDPVEITKQEIDEVMEEIPQGMEVSIPKYHNPFQWFGTDDEGRIFVRTHEQVKEGEEEGYHYDVFDVEGKFIAKVPLKTRPFLIKDNKFYTVEEGEQGFLSIKRYKVTWDY
ncbi:MAG: 6-bladed beta-propeller [Candidatus Aminicenantes bacterium]